MAKDKGSTKKQSPEETLSKVLGDFKSAWDYTSGSWHQRWQNNHYLYNNKRIKKGYQGITDAFVPMVFSTIETLTSALFGSKPKFNYMPPQDRPDQKTDILNGLLDFYWEKDQWSLKIINTGRGMMKLGTSVDYFYWDNDHPCMINVPIRDFFIDPTASSINDAHYMGRRYLTTKDDLKTYEVVNPDTGEMEPKYNNLAAIQEESGSKGDNTDKQEKDMWYGSTVQEPEKHQIEVIEYWTMDRVISVANRSVVIEDRENYFLAKARANGVEYPKGLMPFSVARDYVDESLFYAKGEIDFIGDHQELLNDITNQNIDSISFTLNQMYTLDPKYSHMLNQIENLPGAVYPVDKDALSPIMQRPIPPDAFNERQNIKNEIRETTASNEIVKGVGQDTSANATATEINAQIAGAGQRIGLKVTQIENEYFQRMARIVFEMVKLYVTEPMMVRIVGKDGARWEEFDPEEFQGEYEPSVQLDIEIQNQKKEDADKAQALMAAFMGDPEVNQVELKKMVLQRGFDLDPDEVDKLMTPPEGMGMPGMEGMDPMMGGGMPGAMPPEGMPPMQPPEDLPPSPSIDPSILGGAPPPEEALV